MTNSSVLKNILNNLSTHQYLSAVALVRRRQQSRKSFSSTNNRKPPEHSPAGRRSDYLPQRKSEELSDERESDGSALAERSNKNPIESDGRQARTGNRRRGFSAG